MICTGTAAVITEIRRRTRTSAGLCITGGSAERDLAGNGICRAELTAFADGTGDEALAVLAAFAAAAAASADGDMEICPVSAAYADARENGYVRWCQRYEVYYKGGL